MSDPMRRIERAEQKVRIVPTPTASGGFVIPNVIDFVIHSTIWPGLPCTRYKRCFSNSFFSQKSCSPNGTTSSSHG